MGLKNGPQVFFFICTNVKKNKNGLFWKFLPVKELQFQNVSAIGFLKMSV